MWHKEEPQLRIFKGYLRRILTREFMSTWELGYEGVVSLALFLPWQLAASKSSDQWYRRPSSLSFLLSRVPRKHSQPVNKACHIPARTLHLLYMLCWHSWHFCYMFVFSEHLVWVETWSVRFIELHNLAEYKLEDYSLDPILLYLLDRTVVVLVYNT